MSKATHKNAMIVGATSSLAASLSRKLAAEGWNLVLCGRNKELLDAEVSDITIRYPVRVEYCQLDLAGDVDAQSIYKEAEFSLGHIDALFMVAGYMGEDEKYFDPANTQQIIQVNFTSQAAIMEVASEHMQRRGKGSIVVISSIAGDRGRQKNYSYCSAKAGMTVFADGLRNKLFSSGIHVMTVKPGFIDTPMTYGMESGLIADREVVADAILTAWKKRKDSVYVPFFWRYIMLIICSIPEKLFKRMSL